MTLLDTMKKRQTIYNLGKDLPISNEEFVRLTKDILTNTPSAFNAKTQRLLILTGENHDKLWDIVLETLDEVTGGNSNETIQKITGFRNAAATVLVYKDHEPTQNLVENFPLYADNFPYWATQESGFLQHALWLAYTEAGMGANLQHYNPLIDEKVAKEFDVPSNWELVAQMVVGSKPEIEDKVREDVDSSVIV